jgi:hypothetical protein
MAVAKDSHFGFKVAKVPNRLISLPISKPYTLAPSFDITYVASAVEFAGVAVSKLTP